jgi:hypothetical protein
MGLQKVPFAVLRKTGIYDTIVAVTRETIIL